MSEAVREMTYEEQIADVIMNTFMWLIGKSRLHGGMTVDGIHAEENW